MIKRRDILKIAIDSPAAAGAGTVAKALAKHFNLLKVDTGKAYRLIAFYKLKNQHHTTKENINIEELSDIEYEKLHKKKSKEREYRKLNLMISFLDSYDLDILHLNDESNFIHKQKQYNKHSSTYQDITNHNKLTESSKTGSKQHLILYSPFFQIQKSHTNNMFFDKVSSSHSESGPFTFN